MKVNSIGTTYQTYQTYQNRRKQNINGVKNYTNRDTVSFQGKHSCAKLFTVLLGGIGAIGSYGLSVFSGTNSIQPQFFAIVCGIAGALYGFDRGNYLDEIINAGAGNFVTIDISFNFSSDVLNTITDGLNF